MTSPDLAALGWSAAVDAERADLDVDPGGTPARVARIDRKWCTVVRAPVDDEPLRLPAPEDLAVGDWVLLAETLDRIAARIPRYSALARRSPTGTAEAQVIAANLDHVLVVHALDAEPNQRRLERELVIAFESGATPVVVLNKVDLVGPEVVAERSASLADVAPGVPVHAVSGITHAALDELRAYTTDHRTLALIGPSGAGKSTLVNALAGELVQRTQEVREFDGKGRHTTSAAELVVLPDGGLLIDTPGLRGVALWSEGAGFDEAFADVTELAERCRFRDCTHHAEPGCAVRAAVASGALGEARLRSWQHLRAELEVLRREQEEYERASRRGRRAPRRTTRGTELGDEHDAEGSDDDPEVEVDPGVDVDPDVALDLAVEVDADLDR